MWFFYCENHTGTNVFCILWLSLLGLLYSTIQCMIPDLYERVLIEYLVLPANVENEKRYSSILLILNAVGANVVIGHWQWEEDLAAMFMERWVS